MKPRGRRVTRQGERGLLEFLVRGPRRGEVSHRRAEEDDAVHRDAAHRAAVGGAAHERPGQNGRPDAAVALAHQELWRVPPTMLGQPPLDELGGRLGILVDPEEIPGPPARQDAAEPRADGIDEDQVRDVEQAVRVVLQAEGRDVARTYRTVKHHAPRADDSHVKPEGRRARPPVEDEHHGPLRIDRSVLQVGEAEKARDRTPVQAMEDRLPGDRRVAQRRAADPRGMVGHEARALLRRRPPRRCGERADHRTE